MDSASWNEGMGESVSADLFTGAAWKSLEHVDGPTNAGQWN